jgi:hypothetical protein
VEGCGETAGAGRFCVFPACHPIGNARRLFLRSHRSLSLQTHTGRVAGHRRPAVPGLGALRHPPPGTAHHAVPVSGRGCVGSGFFSWRAARSVRFALVPPTPPSFHPSIPTHKTTTQPPQGLPGRPAPAARPAEHADGAVMGLEERVVGWGAPVPTPEFFFPLFIVPFSVFFLPLPDFPPIANTINKKERTQCELLFLF